MTVAGVIGVFDSGVGGLSVAREIRRRMPREHIIYVADSAYCPYGGRPLEEILARSCAISRDLRSRGAKAIVVACNAASGASLEQLRGGLDAPIIGMEPALKPASERSTSGRIGVMATAATLAADRFDRLLANYGREAEVVAQACPGLVELVERGMTEGAEVRLLLETLLAPLRQARVDTVVLGCTHYPFLRKEIAAVFGNGVELIDSGEAVARQTERVLREAGLMASDGAGTIRVFTTGDPEAVRPVVRRLWGEPLAVDRVQL